MWSSLRQHSWHFIALLYKVFFGIRILFSWSSESSDYLFRPLGLIIPKITYSFAELDNTSINWTSYSQSCIYSYTVQKCVQGTTMWVCLIWLIIDIVVKKKRMQDGWMGAGLNVCRNFIFNPPFTCSHCVVVLHSQFVMQHLCTASSRWLDNFFMLHKLFRVNSNWSFRIDKSHLRHSEWSCGSVIAKTAVTLYTFCFSFESDVSRYNTNSVSFGLL